MGARRSVRLAREGDQGERRRRLSLLPWPLAATLAAVVTVVTGLLPPVALAVLGWVEATDVSFWSALALGVRGKLFVSQLEREV